MPNQTLNKKKYNNLMKTRKQALNKPPPGLPKFPLSALNALELLGEAMVGGTRKKNKTRRYASRALVRGFKKRI